MIKRIIFFTIFLSVMLLADTNQYKHDPSKTVAPGDTVSGDLFFAGTDLRFDGYAESDVYAFSRSAELNGKTGDDFYAFCQNIYSGGEVGGNLFSAGEKVEIEGVIHGDVFAAGGSVLIRSGSVVEGSVHSGTGQFLLEEGAEIKGDLNVGAGNATLGGKVNGKTKAELGNVVFLPSFVSLDSVSLTLPEAPDGDIPNAPENLTISIRPHEHFFQSGFFFWMLISVIVIALITIVLFPELPDRFAEIGQQQWAQNLGYGALFLLVTPVVTVLAIAILPAAFLLAGFYLIMLYLSTVFSAIALGEILLKGKMNVYLRLIVTLAVIYLLVEVPMLGFLVSLLLVIFGMGLFFNYIWNLRKGKWLSA